MQPAAIYVRSSKDRADISLAAQTRELRALAASRKLRIAQTFEDAVRSGNTEDRPGFQALISAIKDTSRGWSTLLVYDTSRIARGRYIAQVFKHRCRRLGIDILYAKVPDTDPVSAVILDAVFEAMDEVHSIMSREKGLAGMRENVRQGWRAGGRAPWGYALAHESTGAVRQGRPVQKSKLVPNHDSSMARDYLQARARGIPRAKIIRDLGVTLSPSTLIGVEWNALVYAGHTIWNRHTEKTARGTGRRKRRERAEWEIHRDTHPAVITDAQAEAILTQLETSDIGRAVSAAKSSTSNYLLSGTLQTSTGQPWIGAGAYYRLRGQNGGPGKHVRVKEMDEAVTRQIRADFQDASFAEEFAAAVRADAASDSGTAGIREQIAKLERQRERAAKALMESGDQVYAKLVDDMARQVAALKREAASLAAEDHARDELRRMSATSVRAILLGMESPRALLACVSRITLDPDLSCRIHYGLSMASPRGFEPRLPP